MHVHVFPENQNCVWTSSCGCEDFPRWRVSVSAWSPWECRLPLNPCSWISSVHPKWQHEMFVSLKVGSNFCFSILMMRLFLIKSSLGTLSSIFRYGAMNPQRLLGIKFKRLNANTINSDKL